MVGENNKVVIVTGGSSGIGRCTASALKENGCIVYEFSRRSIPMEGVTHLSVDVTDEDAVTAAVQQVIQKETKIDAVVNCAGFGISGAVEFTSMEQAKAQFDVNFFGTVTVNKAVLPFMRHQGKGHREGAYCEHQLCCCRSAHSVPDLLLCKQSRRFFLLLRSGKRSQALRYPCYRRRIG